MKKIRQLLGAVLVLVLTCGMVPSTAAATAETIDYSKYLTKNMIQKEEFTLGGIPFCNLSIEEAVQYLPPSELEPWYFEKSYD